MQKLNQKEKEKRCNTIRKSGKCSDCSPKTKAYQWFCSSVLGA